MTAPSSSRRGRLLQRIHLTATSQAIALHHMNQITERIDREATTGAQPTFGPRYAALLPQGLSRCSPSGWVRGARGPADGPAFGDRGDPMSTPAGGRHRLARRLGTAGALLGVAAGLIQVTLGSRIPAWTGAKDATTALGLLTVALPVLAGLAAVRQSRSELSPLARAGWALGLIGPGLLCLSTVGRLWYLPAVLLVAAGWLAVDSWRETAVALSRTGLAFCSACSADCSC